MKKYYRPIICFFENIPFPSILMVLIILYGYKCLNQIENQIQNVEQRSNKIENKFEKMDDIFEKIEMYNRGLYGKLNYLEGRIDQNEK